MSDNVPFVLFVGEGIHDVMSVVRILSLKGFSEISSYDGIPSELAEKMIPKQYPYEADHLTWIIPHPSFLQKDNCVAAVSNAGGESKLGTNLFNLLVPLRRSTINQLKAIMILADADTKTADERKAAIAKQVAEAFYEQTDYDVSTMLFGAIHAYGNNVPTLLYVFPNDRGSGTLETVLLEGAAKSFPDLQAAANIYIDAARSSVDFKAFDADKATVGVIANVLKPGKANQVSIHDNDWFTNESLSLLPLHKQLSDTIDTILSRH